MCSTTNAEMNRIAWRVSGHSKVTIAEFANGSFTGLFDIYERLLNAVVYLLK